MLKTLCFLTTVLFLCLSGMTLFAEETSKKPADIVTGTLTYPAIDHVTLKECTIEFWFRLDRDITPELPAKEYRGFASIMTLTTDVGGFGLHYAAQKDSDKPGLWCSIGPKPRFNSMGGLPPVLLKGEWHHMALGWKNEVMLLFLDGKQIGESTQIIAFYAGLGDLKDPLFIGDKWNRHARFTIDDLRVSRILRKPAELGFHGELKPDPFTTLLDHFEADFTPDGKEPTKPEVIRNGAGGIATAPCCFVPGKFGKALSFFNPGDAP